MAFFEPAESPIPTPIVSNHAQPLMVRLVLATKIVTTPQQAAYVLLGIAMLGIVGTFFFYRSFFKDYTPPANLPDTPPIEEMGASVY